MTWQAIVGLILQILPMILKLLPQAGPQTLKKYGPQLAHIRADVQALDAALESAGVTAQPAARGAVHEEDFTK